MTARDSAYAALGLRPGAGRAEVDDAYRRLIKLHHPDRAGGNSTRAAEINRAYSLLRREGLASGPQSRPVPVVVHAKQRRARSPRDWLFSLVLLTMVIGGFAAMDLRGGPSIFARPIEIRWPVEGKDFAANEAFPLLSFDEPLHSGVIEAAIAEAMKFHLAKDSAGAEIYSRDCQNSLRRERNLAWFDACSAFDEATVTLSTDEDLANSRPFNTSAVVAREMASARVLSDDILGADLRLHQIRSRVELELLPKLDSAAGQSL